MNRKLKLNELNRLSVDDYKSQDKLPIIIVLDNIRSLNNVGAIFRTADAFLVEAIYLCGITAQPPHREIQKTALGATESVKWQFFENTLEAIEKLQKNKYRCWAIEQTENSIMLQDIDPSKNDKIAIVLGNEVAGVEQDVINQCEASLEIPQYGTKHSFNVSVCGGMILWEIFRKMRL